MIRLPVALALAFLASCTPAKAASPACAAVSDLAGSGHDAAPAIAACLRSLPPAASVTIRPGRYALASPLRIERPVAIAPAGSGPRRCPADGAGCIVLVLGRMADRIAANTMPITVAADGVTLDRVVVVGSGSIDATFCAGPKRAAGGGIRVEGSDFVFTGGGVRGVSCYSAMEIVRPAQAPRVENARFGPNGDHRPGERWADGITLHDSSRAVIRDNRFVDNTDVQLILGGCRDCTVTGNVFGHGGSVAGASFAELMIQSWPDTSGDYAGSVFADNHIDCGAARRCGYGIMIGAAPWYPGRAVGGTVTRNRVANAKIGIDIDGLTGPMAIAGNVVTRSGGTYASDCGRKAWPATNIAPGMAAFVSGFDASRAGAGSMPTAGCLLNRNPD